MDSSWGLAQYGGDGVSEGSPEETIGESTAQNGITISKMLAAEDPSILETVIPCVDHQEQQQWNSQPEPGKQAVCFRGQS